MTHRFVRKEDFVGKTIEDINCQAVNVLTFRFTDGTTLALEGDLHSNIPVIVACEECVQQCAPASKLSASASLRKKWSIAERHGDELARLQERCTHVYDNGYSAAQVFPREKFPRCVGCDTLVPRKIGDQHVQNRT